MHQPLPRRPAQPLRQFRISRGLFGALLRGRLGWLSLGDLQQLGAARAAVLATTPWGRA